MTPVLSGQLRKQPQPARDHRPPTCRYSVKKDPSSVFSSCLWAGGDRTVRDSRAQRPRVLTGGSPGQLGGRPAQPGAKGGHAPSVPSQQGAGRGPRPPVLFSCGSHHMAPTTISHKQKLKAPHSESEGHGICHVLGETLAVLGLQPSAPPHPAPRARSMAPEGIFTALLYSVNPAAGAHSGSLLQARQGRLREVQ